MSIQHTPGRWLRCRQTIRVRTADGKSRSVAVVPCVIRRRSDDDRSWGARLALQDGNAQLLALAPTAPHECVNSECPGNVNQLKLEAFDKLKTAAERMAGFLGAWKHAFQSVQMTPERYDEDSGLVEYRAVLANAEKLG